jgi:NitT/TauT family transport system permease protein
MTKVAQIRLIVLAIPIVAFEILCRTGIVDRFTAIPPSEMVVDLARLLGSGKLNGPMFGTFSHIAIAFTSAMVAGIIAGALIHRVTPLRKTLDPLFAAYYAVPIFAFYPLFIVIFGLNEVPQIIIGFMAAVVAVIVNMLNGLDRVPVVLLDTARVLRMGRIETALKVTVPSTTPHILTGAKLAVAYSFTGVIGSEFIMSVSGVGFMISDAYNIFENSVLYPLVLLVLTIAITVNMTFYTWERRLIDRRSRQP